MTNIKFLDFPELVLPDNFYDKENVMYHTKKVGYTAHEITDPKVLATIQDMFNYGDDYGIFHTNVQVINSEFNNYIHWDPRQYAINYLVELGGSNVSTTYYDQHNNPTESLIIPLHKWHLMNSQELHSVNDIETTRIAITLSFRKMSTKMKDWLETKVLYDRV